MSINLEMSTDAYQDHLRFVEELEPRLAPDGDLTAIKDWAGKLPGAVVRIAGLLHLADHSDNAVPERIPVHEDTMDRAIVIGRYLIMHALVAFRVMGTDYDIERAESVLRLVKSWEQPTIKVSEVFDHKRTIFNVTADVRPVLRILVDHGFLRELPPPYRPPGTPGRPESPAYMIRPDMEE